MMLLSALGLGMSGRELAQLTQEPGHQSQHHQKKLLLQ